MAPKGYLVIATRLEVWVNKPQLGESPKIEMEPIIPMPTPAVTDASDNSPVVNGWSFIAFCRTHGGYEQGQRTNKKTNEKFDTMQFDDGVYVGYSSRSFSATPTKAEIIRDKDKLRVVQLESGNYKLCYGQEFEPGVHTSLAELGIV